jgi:DNA-directed RNA polymerase delta subunit
MKTYATASIPKYLLYSFSVIRLEEICLENLVSLKAIRYGENQIICKLYGFKEDIKETIKNLYTEINEDCKNKADIIKKAQKRIPNELKEYVDALNDDENYKKNFEKHADRYIRHCNLNDINPHPEVSEDFVL